MPKDFFQNTLGQAYPKKIKRNPDESDDFTLDEDGTIKAMGENCLGQIGVCKQYPSNYPRTVPLELPNDDRVVEIYSGATGTLFLTKMGKLYACGWNPCGNLGIGGTQIALTPKRVLIPHEERVLSVHAPAFDVHGNMGDSLFIVTETGKIFACGKNGVTYNRDNGPHFDMKTYPDLSRLGVRHTAANVSTPEIVMQLNPNEVLIDIKPTYVGGAYYSALYVWIKTNQRELVYGSNACGELGLGHMQPVMKPMPLELPHDEKVFAIFLHFHRVRRVSTFIFTQSGRIMVCGEYMPIKPTHIESHSENARMPSLDYYHIPPLLVRQAGKVSVFESGDVASNGSTGWDRLVRRYLKLIPLSLPIADDSVDSMELHGLVWRLIGKQATYLCHQNFRKQIIVALETPELAKELDVSPRLPSTQPTVANLHLSGYQAGTFTTQQDSNSLPAASKQQENHI